MKTRTIAAFAALALIAVCAAQTPDPTVHKDARTFATSKRAGSLGTINSKNSAQASVSFATYVVRPKSKSLVFYLNVNAEHSHNLQKQPLASFMISQPDLGEGDPNNLARLTYYGELRKIEETDPDYTAISTLYLDAFPDAKKYEGAAAFHQFAYYVMVPKRISYIAGFGRVYPELDLEQFWKASG